MPEETGNTKVRMRVQDHNTRVVYANAFRHNSTPQEVILDLGINTITGRPNPGNSDDAATEMLFQIDTRLVLNYATTQRLSGMLNQIIQQHQQRMALAQASATATPPAPTDTPSTDP